MKNTDDNLISVIVPVYNVELYLKKCVDSILAQTYRNLEIILVDDGSTDSSPQICDDYISTDDRIRVIHKSNGGLSDARNAGLDAAAGEYITFVDSDDYLAEDAVNVEYTSLVENNADISCIRSVIVSFDYQIAEMQSGTMECHVTDSHAFLRSICERKTSTAVWNKLFSRKAIENHRFIKGRLNEDFPFIALILLNKFLVAETDYMGYYYYTRQGSITHSSGCRSLKDSLQNIDEIINIAVDVQPDMVCHLARLALYQSRTLLIIMPDEEIKKGSEMLRQITMTIQKNKKYISRASLKPIDKCILWSAEIAPIKTALLLHRIRKRKK